MLGIRTHSCFFILVSPLAFFEEMPTIFFKYWKFALLKILTKFCLTASKQRMKLRSVYGDRHWEKNTAM